MNVADQSTLPLELVYEGSVKRVWRAPERGDRLWFEFTDDYSVFDWGKMPDTIANKGRALAIIGAFLFDKLSRPEMWRRLPDSAHLSKFDRAWLDQRFSNPIFSGPDGLVNKGLPNHFRALTHRNARIQDIVAAAQTNEPMFMEVFAAAVNRPKEEHVYNHTLFSYVEANAKIAQEPNARRLIPLEIVFRFGMPSGSSLSERLKKDPSYADELGVPIPKPNSLFIHPVLEFYTKLEPKDRLLSWQEAINLSALHAPQFHALCELSYNLALALYVLFADKQIELWDGKFEMLLEGDCLLVADSIGPDELRLLHKGRQLSKEMVRQMYRGSAWERGLKEAQRIAKTDNTRSWKQIAREQLHLQPEPLPATYKSVVDKLYGVLANHLLGGEIFKNQPGLDAYIRSLPDLLFGQDGQGSEENP